MTTAINSIKKTTTATFRDTQSKYFNIFLKNVYVAKKRKITWKNGGNKVSIKRSDLKNPYLVAKKIQDAGFYDGDLMDLPGINYKTGQLLEDKNLSGKKEKKENSLNITKKTNSSNIVQEIKELKKLLDEGVITEKEFTQAKNKILNNN